MAGPVPEELARVFRRRRRGGAVAKAAAARAEPPSAAITVRMAARFFPLPAPNQGGNVERFGRRSAIGAQAIEIIPFIFP